MSVESLVSIVVARDSLLDLLNLLLHDALLLERHLLALCGDHRTQFELVQSLLLFLLVNVVEDVLVPPPRIAVLRHEKVV